MLRDNDLIEIPKEIGDLARLRELHLQANRLTVIPPEIGELLAIILYYYNYFLFIFLKNFPHVIIGFFPLQYSFALQ